MNPQTKRQASLAFLLLLAVGCFAALFLDYFLLPAATYGSVSAKADDNDDNDDDGETLPEWMSTYAKWHARQRRQFDHDGDEEVLFMVVVCLKGTECGGVSDRIRSLPYWLVLAERTGRVLLIHWNKKYALEDFWMPPRNKGGGGGGGLDWTIPKHFLAKDPFQSSCLQHKAKIIREFEDESNHQFLMNTLRGRERVICVQTRQDLTPLVAQQQPQQQGPFTNNSRAIAQVFQQLFTPTDSLQEFINNTINQQLGMQPGEPFLAAHVRATYPLESKAGRVWPTWEEHSDLMKVWGANAVDRVIATYQQQNPHSKTPPVYVASDSAPLVQYLKASSSSFISNDNNDNNNNGSSVIILGMDGSMPRYHIELDTANKSKIDMFPVFFDLWMLSHSQCVSYGIGSYGKLGARMAGMGCTVQHRSSLQWEDYYNTTRT
jgi:hypothetical protein